MIQGKIGNHIIISMDINKFHEETKEAIWTNNKIYKYANICQIKPKFPIQINQFKSKLNIFDKLLTKEQTN